MLNQYIQIQSSINNQPLITLEDYLKPESMLTNPLQNAFQSSNCPDEKQTAVQKYMTNTSTSEKGKYKVFLKMYEKAVEKLNLMNAQNDSAEKQKYQEKSALQAKLKIFYSNSQNKNRKGSQTSTAGEDQEVKNSSQDSAQNNKNSQRQKISALQKKLDLVRASNLKQSQSQVCFIQNLRFQLKNLKDNHQNQLSPKEEQQKSNEQEDLQKSTCIQQSTLQQKKSSLTQRNHSLTQHISGLKKSIQSFNDNIQYLKSRQNCCQQILDQQLCSLKYKIQGRKIEFDSNKRYLDRVIRNRKNQEKVTFQDIQSQIDYLNDYCSDMMNKKNQQYGPQIKKYKQKRFALLEDLSLGNERLIRIQNSKIQLQNKTKNQNQLHDQLQDEYFALLQKVDGRGEGKFSETHPQEHLSNLKDKQKSLKTMINQITVQYQNFKSTLENIQSLVPQSMIKDFGKKIKIIKQQIHDVQILLKQNSALQKQNSILANQKQKSEWKTNPDIEKLSKEQKNLSSSHAQLNQSVKGLKKQNQLLQEKVNKYRQIEAQIQNQKDAIENQQQRLKREQFQKEEKERLQKQEGLTIKENREKLMQKFRQNKEKKEKQREEQKEREKQKRRESQRQNKKGTGKSKKGKSSSDNKFENLKIYTSLDDPKLKSFFGRRENPLEMLKGGFPLNRSYQLNNNLSLLQSNPALGMLAFYVTVVMPGLFFGYKLL